MYRFLLVLTICSTISLQTWRTLFNNFTVDVAQIPGGYVAGLQGVREFAGFLTFLIVFVLLFMREYKLSALAIVVCGAGLAISGFFPSFIPLIFITFIFSLGLFLTREGSPIKNLQITPPSTLLRRPLTSIYPWFSDTHSSTKRNMPFMQWLVLTLHSLLVAGLRESG